MIDDNKEIILTRKCFASIGLGAKKLECTDGVNITVELFIKGPLDPQTELVVNLTDVDALLKEVMINVDHKALELDLNIKPSPVDLAHYILKACKTKWTHRTAKILGVQIDWGQKTKVYIC